MRLGYRRIATALIASGCAALLPGCGAASSSGSRTQTHLEHAASRHRTKHLRRSAAAPAPILKRGAAASFAALQARIGANGRIAVAVQPLGKGRMEVLGGDPPMLGMSTTKVLILASLLRDRGGASALTSAQRSDAEAAITQSDNQAILALFASLEQDRGGLTGASSYATGLLRDAGDRSTTVATAPPPPPYSTTFGQTPWSPSSEVTFFRALALGCILPRGDTSYVLGLMRSIVPSERWGFGSAGFPTVAFKGGWGPLSDSTEGVRQTAIIGGGDSGAVASVTVDPAPTFATGTADLTAIARWLRSHLVTVARPGASCER